MIGTVYFYIGITYGVVGFFFSVYIRCELSCFGEQVHFGDYQYYNVFITSHSLLMIFFFVMPSLISG